MSPYLLEILTEMQVKGYGIWHSPKIVRPLPKEKHVYRGRENILVIMKGRSLVHGVHFSTIPTFILLKISIIK
jgi:hypothetical protein